MTVVRRLTPVNRLAAMIHKPGGLKESQAIAAAEANLEGLREQTMERLDAVVAAMAAEADALSGYDAEAVDRMYRLSNEVVGVAGVFGYGHMGEAAYSLCELLDNLGARKAWNWPAVQVHLNGLLLLAEPDNVPPQARKSVVDGLRQVCRRVSSR